MRAIGVAIFIVPLLAGGALAATEATDSTALQPVAQSETSAATENCNGGTACDSCCCCCDPCAAWRVEAEALFLKRNNHSVRQPVVVNSLTGDTDLGTRDLGFDTEIGPRLTLGMPIGDCGSSLELSYFGLHFWRAGAFAADPNNLSLAGDLGRLAPSDYNMADTMRLDYSSELHNVEVNYVVPLGRISFLTGFRYVDLGERFNINADDSDSGTSDYTIRTRNHLFGGQIGVQVKREYCRFGWELTGKAGLFGNSAEQRSLARDLDNTILLRDTCVHSSGLAFVGDLGLTATWQLTHWLTLRGGYNLIWIEGVALAPDQLDFTYTSTSGTALHRGGGVFLHGFSTGLEARW